MAITLDFDSSNLGSIPDIPANLHGVIALSGKAVGL